jgi:4-amino-4-deoxy-L-arabinose transferase-like glycosyltransferase
MLQLPHARRLPWPTWWLAAVALAAMALAFQGTRALWEPDEGRYTAVALQMLDSGDWLTPRLNDAQLHVTKPPLSYWAIAASLGVFGQSAWAARVPNALAFVLTGLFVLGLGQRLVPARPWLPVLLWGSSLLPVLAANVVSTDALLALWETAAVFAFVRGAGSGHRRERWYLLMWLAFGLGFLTKGPPALLPLLPILLWSALAGGRSAVLRLFPLPGLAGFALLGGGWFAWMLVQRPALLGYFLGHEVVERLFSATLRRNPEWYGPAKIYLPVLVLCVLPWLGLARGWLAAVPGLIQPAAWRRRMVADRAGAFLLLWLLLPLAVFTLARSRQFLYVLPLAVPIALLLARQLSARFGAQVPARWRRALALWPLVALVGKGALMAVPTHKDAAVQAAALAGHLASVDRIVFVGERAHYGLRFYTGRQVEQRALGARARLDGELCRAAAGNPQALLVGPVWASGHHPPCAIEPLVGGEWPLWRARHPDRAAPVDIATFPTTWSTPEWTAHPQP